MNKKRFCNIYPPRHVQKVPKRHKNVCGIITYLLAGSLCSLFHYQATQKLSGPKKERERVREKMRKCNRQRIELLVR